MRKAICDCVDNVKSRTAVTMGPTVVGSTRRRRSQVPLLWLSQPRAPTGRIAFRGNDPSRGALDPDESDVEMTSFAAKCEPDCRTMPFGIEAQHFVTPG